MDGMVGHCTVRRATRRWPMRLFMTMIDVGALAGFVLYISLFESMSRGNRDRFRYLLSASEDLMKMSMSCRRINRNIPEGSRSIALGESQQPPIQERNRTNRAQKRGRCWLCSQKSNSAKHSHQCDKCERFVCLNHCEMTCFCQRCS